MATEFLVELYLPCRDRAQVDELDARVRAAVAELVSQGTPISYVRSIGLPSDEVCLCLFTADGVGAVAEAARRAGISPDRIVATGHVAANQPPRP
jgi:hypothetical protein